MALCVNGCGTALGSPASTPYCITGRHKFHPVLGWCEYCAIQGPNADMCHKAPHSFPTILPQPSSNEEIEKLRHDFNELKTQQDWERDVEIFQMMVIRKKNAKYHAWSQLSRKSDTISNPRDDENRQEFRRKLKKYYGKKACCISNEEKGEIVAAHILPRSRAKLCGDFKIPSVDDERNGCFMLKQYEEEFDLRKFTMIYDFRNTQFYIKKLDPQSTVQDGIVVSFPQGRHPFKRVLSWHATSAIDRAFEYDWIDIADVKKFKAYSETSENVSIRGDETGKEKSTSSTTYTANTTQLNQSILTSREHNEPKQAQDAVSSTDQNISETGKHRETQPQTPPSQHQHQQIHQRQHQHQYQQPQRRRQQQHQQQRRQRHQQQYQPRRQHQQQQQEEEEERPERVKRSEQGRVWRQRE